MNEDFDEYNLTSPSATPGGACLMGSNFVLRRRKACTVCINGLEKEKEMDKSTPCPCTYQDFKCGFGFYRADNIDNEDAQCSEDKDMFAEMCTNGDTTKKMSYVGISTMLAANSVFKVVNTMQCIWRTPILI